MDLRLGLLFATTSWLVSCTGTVTQSVLINGTATPIATSAINGTATPTATTAITPTPTATTNNQAPLTPTELSISPVTLYKTSSPKCVYTTSIVPTNSIIAYTVAWLRNDTLVTGQNTDDYAGALSQGDSLACRITANAGSLSKSIDSAASIVQNQVPVTGFSVPTNFSGSTGIGSILTCSPIATDPDGDTLTYSYQWKVSSECVKKPETVFSPV